jgi:hypothetical protein
MTRVRNNRFIYNLLSWRERIGVTTTRCMRCELIHAPWQEGQIYGITSPTTHPLSLSDFRRAKYYIRQQLMKYWAHKHSYTPPKVSAGYFSFRAWKLSKFNCNWGVLSFIRCEISNNGKFNTQNLKERNCALQQV